MARIVVFAILAAWCACSASAQPAAHPIELSLGGSLQAVVMEDETVHLMSIPMRVGVFVTRPVSVEMEGILTGLDEELADETTWGYIVTASLAYHFPVTGSVHPFFLFGYGFSDSWPFAGVFAPGQFSGAATLGVLNAGGGVKAMLADRAAMRIEYRLQKFSGDDEGWDIDFTIHSTMFGVSVFL
ncbi:MAG: outer membrane beta-barrel protein [Candidatus Eisenbacteria bacterium]|nr:outer membrane beta-barrel protein [Candidatus Eisenbacteria bacterium]